MDDNTLGEYLRARRALVRPEDAGIRVTGGGADSQPHQAHAEIANLLASGKLDVTVRTFPMAQAAEALRISQGGHVRGKLVLLP